MALATWWRGDKRPRLSPDERISVTVQTDDAEMAALNGIEIGEVKHRWLMGHVAYLARVNGSPAAYGWVATRSATIGELDLHFLLPANDRYLWNFATLPQWQSQGIYPRLLQGILRAEKAARFWIIFAPENLPSGAGIEKAGFRNVGQLSFVPDGSVGLAPLAEPERAQAGAALLGVPVLDETLSPCWKCVDKLVCNCHLDPESCACAISTRRSQNNYASIAGA